MKKVSGFDFEHLATKKDIARLDEKVSEQGGHITTLETRMDSLEKQMATGFDEVISLITSIAESIKPASDADYEERFLQIESDVDKLTIRVSEHDSTIAKIHKPSS